MCGSLNEAVFIEYITTHTHTHTYTQHTQHTRTHTQPACECHVLCVIQLYKLLHDNYSLTSNYLHVYTCSIYTQTYIRNPYIIGPWYFEGIEYSYLIMTSHIFKNQALYIHTQEVKSIMIYIYSDMYIHVYSDSQDDAIQDGMNN